VEIVFLFSYFLHLFPCYKELPAPPRHNQTLAGFPYRTGSLRTGKKGRACICTLPVKTTKTSPYRNAVAPKLRRRSARYASPSKGTTRLATFTVPIQLSLYLSMRGVSLAIIHGSSLHCAVLMQPSSHVAPLPTSISAFLMPGKSPVSSPAQRYCLWMELCCHQAGFACGTGSPRPMQPDVERISIQGKRVPTESKQLVHIVPRLG